MQKSPSPGSNPQTHKISIDSISDFDEIIDVRTPAEFAIDHIHGAINAPVLSNAERARIGTMYTQESAFKATKLGAALVARNIAKHLETTFIDKPKNWRPLIYCWRGGKRSGAMTSWLNLIGWRAYQLDGGYKAWRKNVVAKLAATPMRFKFIVLVGPTGSGKTRLLHALKKIGAQVLDLEGLARHRGSLLGKLPDQAQPAQKGFESHLLHTLESFNPAIPVFVEAESRRIGLIHLPDSLLQTMHQGDCVYVDVAIDDRINFLLEDYPHLFAARSEFKQSLSYLKFLHGGKTIENWFNLIDNDSRYELFKQLIELHYDPAYKRSSKSHFVNLQSATPFTYQPLAGDTQAQTLIKLLNYPIS